MEWQSGAGLTLAHLTRVRKHAKSTAVDVAPRSASMLKPPLLGKRGETPVPRSKPITIQHHALTRDERGFVRTQFQSPEVGIEWGETIKGLASHS
jgi:hypothetical protein